MKTDRTTWQEKSSQNLPLHIYPTINLRECTLLDTLIWIKKIFQQQSHLGEPAQ